MSNEDGPGRRVRLCGQPGQERTSDLHGSERVPDDVHERWRGSQLENGQLKMCIDPTPIVFIGVINPCTTEKNSDNVDDFFMIFFMQPEDFRGFEDDECVRFPKNQIHQGAKETCKQTTVSYDEQNERDAILVSAGLQQSTINGWILGISLSTG